MKHCNKCGETKLLTDFSHSKAQHDGYRTCCKTCQSAYSRDWYRKNRAKLIERAQRWRGNNPEKDRSIKQRRRARKQLAASQLTAAQWRWLLKQTDHRCVYCGQHEADCGPLQQEHVVPLSQGGAYTISNVRPACGKCNLRKRDRTPEQAGMETVIKINPLEHMKQETLFDTAALGGQEA